MEKNSNQKSHRVTTIRFKSTRNKIFILKISPSGTKNEKKQILLYNNNVMSLIYTILTQNKYFILIDITRNNYCVLLVEINVAIKKKKEKNAHFYPDKNRGEFRIPHSAGLVQRTYKVPGVARGGCFRLQPRHRSEGAGNRRPSRSSRRTVRPDPRRRPNRRHPVRVRRAFVSSDAMCRKR